jgi:diguanylate cyclase (GGDEF)-like protein/PAS domain S-box-containing protein
VPSRHQDASACAAVKKAQAGLAHRRPGRGSSGLGCAGYVVTLRTRTLVTIGVTLVGLMGALYLISQIVVVGGFADQEKLDAQREVARVIGALDDDLSHLQGTVADWATWDDTYNYVNTGDERYHTSNLLGDVPMSSNDLSLMAFVSSWGEIVFVKWYDRGTATSGPVPAGLGEHLAPGKPLSTHTSPNSRISGLILLPEGPLTVVSMPILRSDGSGPAAGALVMGRMLDTHELTALSQTTLISLTAYRVDAPNLPRDFAEVMPTLSAPRQVAVQPLNDGKLGGYTMLADIYGKPAVLLRAELPRSTLARGQGTVQLFMVGMVLVGLVFGLVVLALLERLVMARLLRLSAGVESIAQTRKPDARVEEAGGDELGGLARDINRMLDALAESSERSRQSEARFQAVFKTALDPFMVFDDSGKIVEANPAACKLLGLDEQLVLGHTFGHFLPEPSKAAVQELWEKTLAEGGGWGETHIMMADGQHRDIEFYTRPNVLPGNHFVAVRDVTDRKLLEGRLEYQAFHDSLTGLPNRTLFLQRLSNAVERSRRGHGMVALLFLDLDDFKVINDSLGHKAGDRLLMSVSERLLTCLRPGDMVARLGGDEFTVLVDSLNDVRDAQRVAGRIVESFKRPFGLDGQQVFISTSIGIALSVTGSERPDDLLRNADVAMYDAKQRGKSRYAIFDQSMNVRAWKRLQTEIDLRRALDKGEFVVYYQPVVRLDTRGVIEVEALVRWQHPQRGLVPPAEFIPVAEETGLIVDLGLWVLDQSCKQMRQWQKSLGESAPAAMGVNLSARQFKDPALVTDIRRVLRDSGLDARCLNLEITESVGMDDPDSAGVVLSALRDMGVSLTLDDFGTGYSALSHLRRFPINGLKIDGSFVRDMGVRAEDTAIVHALVAFARTLKLKVAAEGVETAEQAAYLHAIGCDRGQGYYFARPVGPAQMEVFLKAGKLPLEVMEPALRTG